MKTRVQMFQELLEPGGITASLLQEDLREAADRAGLRPTSSKAQARQRAAANGRKIQRQEDLAYRRLLVSSFFKQLPRTRRLTPGSLATAQAIIGRMEELPWDKVRKPPITVRTVQADIQFLRKNRNFGI